MWSLCAGESVAKMAPRSIPYLSDHLLITTLWMQGCDKSAQRIFQRQHLEQGIFPSRLLEGDAGRFDALEVDGGQLGER